MASNDGGPGRTRRMAETDALGTKADPAAASPTPSQCWPCKSMHARLSLEPDPCPHLALERLHFNRLHVFLGSNALGCIAARQIDRCKSRRHGPSFITSMGRTVKVIGAVQRQTLMRVSAAKVALKLGSREGRMYAGRMYYVVRSPRNYSSGLKSSYGTSDGGSKKRAFNSGLE